ncbi:MAG: DNA repair protein RecO [Clostridia bacterium]|nr:DNA repair protein RecO [Clostridia bacterium]
MKITTDGLVIREQSLKEQDKVLTVLTSANGIIRAFIHGAKSIKSPKSTASGLLTYSDFEIYKSRDNYIIDDARAKEVFMPVRRDIEKLALGQYFCELLAVLAPEESQADDFLRLALNALYFLSKGDRPVSVIKSAFELKLMTMAGFMPDLTCCCECGCYEHENMIFIPESGKLLCGDCSGISKKKHIQTGISITHAMRHCVYSEMKKLFAFTLPDDALSVLEYASENYIAAQVPKNFKTLDFYKTLRI